MSKSVKDKLLDALDIMIEKGEKINPSALEKRAKVSNGMATYHDILNEKVLYEIGLASSKSDGDVQADAKLKKQLKDTRAKLKDANTLKSKYYNDLKALEIQQHEHADLIANLVWSLHKETSSEVLSEHVVSIKKH